MFWRRYLHVGDNVQVDHPEFGTLGGIVSDVSGYGATIVVFDKDGNQHVLRKVQKANEQYPCGWSWP
jgi:hypothetical protein